MLKNLKSQYEQEKRSVSPDIWETLKDKLADSHTNPKSKIEGKSRKKILWWSAAAVIILIASLAKFNLTKDLPKQNTILAVKENNTVLEKNASPNQDLKTSEKIKSIDNIEKQHLVQNQKNTVISEEKIIVSEVPKQMLSTVEEPQVLAENSKTETPKPKYISSKDLLFGIELDKTRNDQQNNQNSKLGMTDYKTQNSGKDFDEKLTPKSLKILGFTIFDKDSTIKK